MEDAKEFVNKQIIEIKKQVGKERAIVALSGGVDSSAVAILAHKAIGKQLTSIFIDDGLMREAEAEEVKAIFRVVGIEVKIIDRKQRFFDSLKGLTNPEEKRKAFRDTFYMVLGEEVKKINAGFMLQGTIKADVIETEGGIKTQHNVLEQIGIDPMEYGLQIIEPLKELFKPEVREVAKEVGLPEEIHQRMPFPGPGLATRVLGEVTSERVDIVRKATSIVEEEIKTSALNPFQAFAVLLSDKATGVKGGKRAFGEIIVVRSVESTDAMTALPSKISFEVLEKIQKRITAEIPSVGRVVYDLTPKPPATIEYI